MQTSAPDQSRAWSYASALRYMVCAVRPAFLLGLNLRIRVLQLPQIRRPGPRIQLAKHGIITLVLFQLRHAAVRIIHVSKNDRLGRTNGLAGSHDLTVLDSSVLKLRLNFRVLNTLHAVSALLHHATAPHGHLRIAHQLISRRGPVLVKEEIEAAYLVRAVVRTIFRPDAAVVNHVVQAFGTVHGRVDRTNRLARRVLAVHARHRHEVDAFRMTWIKTSEVGIDANPVHLATAYDFVFADDGNVVL